MEEHIIPITNGKGTKELINATYDVTATVSGYDNSSITPNTQEVTEVEDNYSFTISATGTLTLHVSDDGTEIGIPIVGAKFVRCDAEGTTYGGEITSDDSGNAVFNNVPYLEGDTPPNIYYKQTSSDGEHNFGSALQTITLEASEKTVEVLNAPAKERKITLTDAYYENLPIEDGAITFTKQQ